MSREQLDEYRAFLIKKRTDAETLYNQTNLEGHVREAVAYNIALDVFDEIFGA